MRGYLNLEDGTFFEGVMVGASKESEGEVVFTTGMTGYPESLTDPSYAGQILVFTYPLIGNYGVPTPTSLAPHIMENFESEAIRVRGVIVSDAIETASHYTMSQTFGAWCTSGSIPILSGIDTRALTQKLREHGTMRGIISFRKKKVAKATHDENLVPSVSIAEPIVYGARELGAKHVVLIDCGVKHGILRALISAGFRVTRIPHDYDPLRIKGIDGIVCSNGPGDPKQCKKTIANIKKVMSQGVPFLGICLGHQLLALAAGATTYKLSYGHRGLNQPCQDVQSKKAYITSQNHGYAVDSKTIPKGFSEWFINLNDGTNEGLCAPAQKIWSIQFHPEGNPGPSDTDWVFSMFRSAL